MPTLTAATPGTFCWLELAARDAGAARRFYTELFGWTTVDTKIGPGENDLYTIFQLDGQSVAAQYQLTPEMPAAEMLGGWLPYIAVENAEASAGRVSGLGGTVVGGPMDVMQHGRMALVRDPGGAVFALWQPINHQGYAVAGEPGSVGWNELATPDAAQATAFYQGLFGWEPQTTSMGEFDYTTFSGPTGLVGGMYPLTEAMQGMPPSWTPYFAVADADAAAEKARSLGATIHVEPSDIPGVGRFALVQDPQGAMFNLIRFTMPAASS